ncbi:MAG TPA: family 10 glycosylhydrolase [Candidatus Obscuribacterales bacterium]
MKRTLLQIVVVISFMLLGAGAACAQSPLAVLKSETDAAAYSEQHLGTFEDDFSSFKTTLESANVRYDILTDADLKSGVNKLSPFKMIVIPFFLDIPADSVSALQDYVRGGGKLLITDGGGTLSAPAQTLLKVTGAQVTGHSTFSQQEQLDWPRQPQPLLQTFAVGTAKADIGVDAGALTAKWTNAQGQDIGAAVSRLNGNTFISWAPGLQGEITANAQILSLAMEDAVPGITQQAAVQISFADYQNIQQELDYLTKRTDEAIKTARQADLAVPFKMIQSHYDAAVGHVKAFQDAYSQRRFYQADDELVAARNDFALAFAQAMPVRLVETRGVWLDRGTIVAARDRAGLAAVFDRLKSAGINVVYFETNNAGYCMYPSQVSAQNPQTAGWDPLGAAVEEAHKRGMQLISWVWIFNVGNMMHNPIIGKEADFPGPVLSGHDFSWALAAHDGSLLAHNQHEFWIDPSNPDGKDFIKQLCLEVVTKYPVDGLQFDYIRYPFNGKGTEMGFDWAGRTRFERETGANLDRLDEDTRELWMAWKISQVSNFVKETSMSLRKAALCRNLRITAAVYALPKRWRLSAIQQEWETWVANGWVDALNPMTYVATAKELATNAGYVREQTADKALVFPGLSIRQLDTAGLIEQLDTARAIGTLGTTMFAVAHLDDKKINVLRLGPYRRLPVLSAEQDPLRASRLLIDNFSSLVNRYLQDPQKHILSDQASTNDVLSQIDSVQRQIHELKPSAAPTEIADAARAVANLESAVKNWLRIEAFVQRGYRAQYITDYLSQIEAVLSYASQHAKTQATIAAAASASR